jgi:hypothetical protein
VIEPGGIKDRMARHRRRKGPRRLRHRTLRPAGNAVAKSLVSESTRRRSSPPELIAMTIGKAVTTRRPEKRYPVGYGPSR